MVKGLVELHGGAVEAQSGGAGKGSRFTITLPLCRAPAAPVAEERRGAGPSRHVLIIDDNVDAADTMCSVLELAGHRPEATYDGRSGLALAREHHPEVIVCDLGLPGMDGFAFARAVRNDPALRNVFLIALTGYAHPEDIIQSRAAGFDRHLAKPARLEALEQLVAEAG
jgi:CheY-like chemotaxis protein